MKKQNIAGVILAGGRASRMGYADKPLLRIHGQPILSHIIAQSRDQVSLLLLNVNRNLEGYRPFGLPLVPDLPDNADGGPLAGISAAIQWLVQQKLENSSAAADITHIACFPGDTPVFPRTLVARLSHCASAVDADNIAWLSTAGQLQPLFSLWPLSILPALQEALGAGQYSPRYFIEAQRNILLDIEDVFPADFLNINDPESLAEAEMLMQGRSNIRI